MSPVKSALYLLFAIIPGLLLIYPMGVVGDGSLLLLGIIWCGSIAGLVIYIRHLWRNRQVQKGKRDLWLLSMLLAFMPVSVLYWFYYLRPSQS